MLGMQEVVTSVPVLRQKGRPLEAGAIKERVANTLPAMRQVLERTRGVGLAAIQVGIPERFFLVTYPFEDACFNPEILESSPETVRDREGCLSIGGGQERYEVDRPARVRVAYTDGAGRKVERSLEGLAARVFQHEYDHLEGRLISDHGTRVLSEA